MSGSVARRRGFGASYPALFATGGAVMLGAIAVYVMTGPLALSFDEVISVLQIKFSGAEVPQDMVLAAGVVWDLRLLRVLMAVFVGACLATCGAAMQGLFGNPLADPGIVGVTSGASLGAVLIIVSDLVLLGPWMLPAGAFVAGTLTTMIIYALAQPGAGHDTSRLLLVGIAVNAIIGAVTAYFTYLASTDQLFGIVFWGMGSMAEGSWSAVAILVPLSVIGVTMLLSRATELDLLALGEQQARHLGVDVKRLRLELVLICALLVAAAVSFTGGIGFVGLVVPHLVRLLVGPGHRLLIPLSAFGGGLLVMLADIAARTLDPPNEIPIGILTASIGAPFFLWLVYAGRARRSMRA